MKTATLTGRVVGILLIAQMAGSYLVNFGLLAPLTEAPGGLLASAAAAPLRVGVWGLLGLGVAALSLALPIVAWPVFRRSSERLALTVLALGAVALALQAVEHVGLLSVLSLSEARATAASAPAGLFETTALLARSLRNWLHFTALVVAGGWSLAFCATLWRGQLVPRVLAASGVVAAVLQASSVALPFLGREVVFPLLAPMGIAYLLIALWLLWRGFAEPVGGNA